MKVNIKAQNIKLTVAISSYLEKRLASTKKFLGVNDETTIAYVELGKISRHHKAGDYFKAEAHLHVWGKEFSASAVESDLYVAIDKMRDELVQELTTHKERKTSLERKGERQIKALLQHMRSMRGAREE